MNNLLNDSWALRGTEPRDAQKKIMAEVISAIDDGYHNIIINAGTGIGKSAIAVTLDNYYNKTKGWSSYILTKTTQLQEQYVEDFNHVIKDLQGRAHYNCKLGDKCDNCIAEAEKRIRMCLKCPNYRFLPSNADYTINEYGYPDFFEYCVNEKDIDNKFCIKEKYKSKYDTIDVEKEKYWFILYCNDCEYRIARVNARNSEITSMNYVLYNLMTCVTYYFPSRDLLVLDEAHKLEEVIMNNYSLEITDYFTEKQLYSSLYSYFVNPDDIKKNELIEALKRILDDISTAILNLNPNDGQYSRKKNRLNAIGSKINGLISNNHVLDNYVWEYQYKPEKLVLKPIDAREQAKNFLDKAHTRIFLTATIGSKDLFLDWLSLDSNDSYLIEADSPFNVENRPINLKYAQKMSGYNRKEKKYNWHNQKALNNIYTIINKHGGERGCIHTVSNAQSSFIIDFLESKDISYINVSGKDRNKLLNEYIENDSIKLLIGSAIKDGVDLKDDLCRFQILFKIPYPNLGDKQIKARMNREPVWYSYQTVMDLLQAYGRGVRNEDDYCSFYVLDSSIKRLLKTNKDLFSRYFLEAIQ